MQELQLIFSILKVQLNTSNKINKTIIKQDVFVSKNHKKFNTVLDYKSFLNDMTLKLKNYNVSSASKNQLKHVGTVLMPKKVSLH